MLLLSVRLFIWVKPAHKMQSGALFSLTLHAVVYFNGSNVKSCCVCVFHYKTLGKHLCFVSVKK